MNKTFNLSFFATIGFIKNMKDIFSLIDGIHDQVEVNSGLKNDIICSDQLRFGKENKQGYLFQ